MTTHRVDLSVRTAMPRWLIAVIGTSMMIAAFGLFVPTYVRDLGARATIETTMTICAIATVSLLVMCFRARRRLGDLLLLTALVTVALVDFTSSALPAMIGGNGFVSGIGVQVPAHVLAALAFVAAAFAPADNVVAGRSRLVLFGAVGLAAISVADVVPILDHCYGVSRVSPQTGLQAAAARPILVAVQIICTALLMCAAAAFLRRRDHADQEPALLASAAGLLAAGCVLGLAFPTVGADWVTPASGLRMLAYGLLLAAAVKQYERVRGEAAWAMLAAQRGRMAQDLHDGLAQDLAFIASHSDRLASELGVEHPLTIAAKRALAVSRGAIVDLAASTAPTCVAALRSVADEMESRHRVEIAIGVDRVSQEGATRDLDPAQREELVRIAREAMINAIRHGGAHHVDVRVGFSARGLLLRISDDGCGIAGSGAGSCVGTGLGMRTMRARARRLGGRLVTRSNPGEGTELEVLV